jgi:hypothetical protein
MGMGRIPTVHAAKRAISCSTCVSGLPIRLSCAGCSRRPMKWPSLLHLAGVFTGGSVEVVPIKRAAYLATLGRPANDASMRA